MLEERGQVAGDITIAEPYTLWGSIGGNVRVVDGSKFYVRGSIYGNVVAEDGGRMHILGQVKGHLTVMKGAKVIVSGVINGDAINKGGRLYIEASGTVTGKVKTKSGETVINPDAKARE